MLKRLADVRDERVYAVIRGTGVAGDGRAASLMAPQAGGQVAAMRAAWAAAGLDPREPGAVGLVEAHGTATVAGDATELASLTEVFGPAGAAGADIGIGSVKSMIGHAMPAAGAAGLIKAALAVSEGFLPPTLHCDDPHPAMAGTRFLPVSEMREWESAGPRRAAVNAFGFGGINSHVVLEQMPAHGAVHFPGTSGRPAAVRAGSPDATEKVLLFAGADAAAIAAQLDAPDEVLLARDDTGAPPSGGAIRLAIVHPDAKRLSLARKVAAQGTGWRGRNDVWFSPAPLLSSGGKVAFLFPGLEEIFSPRVDDVAAHFGLPPVRAATDATLGRRGLELAGVGRLLHSALGALDLQPDVVAGHSIGEWSALIAAGAAPFEEFADSTRAFDAGPGVPDLVFGVIGGGADLAVQVIADLPDVVLSHDNCPHQSIVCGTEASVATVLDRLRTRGVSGSVLAFRSGFHTPYLEPFLGPSREFIAGLTLRPPRVPLWSTTTAAPYPDDPAEVRALLLRNLVEPVLFGPLIQRLYADGVRAFVQVGTGSLPGFVEDVLDSAATPHLSISANVPKRTGLEQLRRVAAALWTEGAAPRFSRLTAGAEEPEPAPVRVAPPARPSSPAFSVTLNLGAPLTRLTETPGLPTHQGVSRPGVAAHRGVSRPGGAGGTDPVLDEFAALLADAEAGAAEVRAALQAEPAMAPGVPSPVAAAPGALSGEPRTASTTRTLSLASDPYLADHCLLQGPDDAGPAVRFPIVPMTGTIALITEAAAALVPEHLVIGVRNVRALRPIVVEPEITLFLEAREHPAESGPTTVTVTVEGQIGSGRRETYARASVLLADAYPAPPAPAELLTAERVPDIDPISLYADRWMFHGPAFRGVVELTAIADDGVRGVVAELAAPGSLLDAAGQLLGYWVATQPYNGLALPFLIETIDFFGPPPPTGTLFPTTVRVRSLADAEVSADLTLHDTDGQVWCSVTGWTDRRMEGDARTLAAFRHPARVPLAERQEAGWHLLIEPWSDPAARDIAARQYLSAAEYEQLEGRTPRSARHWLLGRIAAKDAVRDLLWAEGAGPLYPFEIEIGNEASGAPRVSGPGTADLHLSLAHSGTFAAAVVGRGSVGIDLELVSDAPAEAALLTVAERELLETIAPGGDPVERATWVTRFWTAKEAVAKAAGTGLGGRPARFVVTRVEIDRLLVVVDGAARWVTTASGALPQPYAVGWTRESDILGTDLGS